MLPEEPALTDAAIRQRTEDVDANQLTHLEQDHPFNRYIAVLEKLRAQLGQQEDSFYLLLLQTKLTERAALLQRMGDSMLDLHEKGRFRTSLLLAQAALTKEMARGA
jgi:hypothetical protein